LTFVAYIGAILLIFSSVVFFIERGYAENISEAYGKNLVAEKSRHVSLWLEERIKDITTLALTETVGSLESTQYLPFLKEAIEQDELLYGRYFVVDLEGNSMDTLGLSETISKDQGYKKIINNQAPMVITTPSEDEIFKQPTFKILVPIKKDNQVIGVMGATVLLEALSQVISLEELETDGFTWMVDDQEQIISHRKGGLKMILTTPEDEDYQPMASFIESMATKQADFAYYKDASGQKTYVLATEIEAVPEWKILVSLYAPAIYQKSNQLIKGMVMIVIILLILSVGMAYFLAKQVTNPIVQLIEVMKKFTSGIKGIRAKIESKDEIGALSNAFNAMADTIVAHTENLEELIQERTQVLADLNHQIISRNKELGTMNTALEKTNNQLHELASTDMLTGLYNRHQFQRDLQKTIDLVNVGDEQNFSILFIDLDNFKYYNDTFSHEVGDFLLQEVAGILKSNVRENDMVGRYGGDEFVILLRQGTYEIAKEIAERMHKTILEQDGFKKVLAKKLNASVKIMGKNKLSCSIGIVNYMKSLKITKAEDLLAKADATMYKAKKAGKSRVVVD